MSATRLILLRHGRTEWNATGRFQGQADIALDDLGQTQAAAAAEALMGEKIDVIWASDLQRARVTAEIVADSHGLPVLLDARLREISVGSWEGLTAEEVGAADPDYAAAYARGEDVRRSSTGENSTEVAGRVVGALREIVEGSTGTVLIGTHGMAARLGMCAFLDLPYAVWHTFGGLNNCHWIDLVADRLGRWRLRGYNVGRIDQANGEQPVNPIERAAGDRTASVAR